jgi:3'(2'), 5'-bisphosphate nucleotidase
VTPPLDRFSQAAWLAAAIDAVRAAALATQAVGAGRTRDGSLASVAKDDASPVTIADFASQAVVLDALEATIGPVHLLGEESDDILRDPAQSDLLDAVVRAAQVAVPTLDRERVLALLARDRADPSREACWTLDPVDGTKGFLRGGQYAIALAYIESGRPLLGAMACPRLALDIDDPALPVASGLIACAVRGAGARWCGIEGDIEDAAELRAPAWHEGDPVSLLLSVESAHGDGDTATDAAGRCGPLATPLRLDSASKYVLLSHGRGNAYLRVPRVTPGKPERKECVWDHAAGVLIAEEAGCRVSDLDGKPLDFSAGATLARNRGLVAAPPALADRLVAAIASLGR